MDNPIINKFYIHYNNNKHHTMFCHLINDTYTKTYTLNQKVISDNISIDEYAAALLEYLTASHNT
jgi:hypothetical protein